MSFRNLVEPLRTHAIAPSKLTAPILALLAGIGCSNPPEARPVAAPSAAAIPADAAPPVAEVDRVAPLLARMVEDGHDLRDSKALVELLALDESAAPGLRKAVLGADQPLALAAVAGLRIQLRAPERQWVAGVLRTALGASDPVVRGWAADALGFASLGGDPPAEVVTLARGALADPSPLVRSYAAHALVQLEAADPSPEIVAALISGLSSDRADLRYDAVVALGRLGPAAGAAIPALTGILADPRGEETRGERAAEALAHMGDPGAAALMDALAKGGPRAKERIFALAHVPRPLLARLLPEAIAGLADPEPRVRRLAAGAVGRAGAGRPAAAQALEKALGDASHYVVQAAARALVLVGPEARVAIPRLLTIVQGSPASRLDAIVALGGMGPAAKSALPLLRAHVAEEPEAVTHALAQLGPTAIPALTAALAHADPAVRRAAAWALRYLGREAAPAVGKLAAALRDPKAEVRNAAAQALGAIGPGAASAVPKLVAVLEADPDDNVRSWSANALGHLGPAAASALPALQKAAGDPRTHHEATLALAAVASPAVAVPVLLALAEEKGRYTTEGALAALGDLGPRAAAAAPTMRAKLVATPDPTRETLPWAVTLARIDGSPDAIAYLERGLASPTLGLSAAEPLVRFGKAGPATIDLLRASRRSRRARDRGRASALLAQALPADFEAVKALLATLAEIDSDAVREAVHVLAPGPVPVEALAALTALLGSDEVWERRGAAQALGKLGAAGRPALPALGRLLFDGDADARWAALSAIKEIGGK
jgi:HEAT repeat protein